MAGTSFQLDREQGTHIHIPVHQDNERNGSHDAAAERPRLLERAL